jgi:hypothetical protein
VINGLSIVHGDSVAFKAAIYIQVNGNVRDRHSHGASSHEYTADDTAGRIGQTKLHNTETYIYINPTIMSSYSRGTPFSLATAVAHNGFSIRIFEEDLHSMFSVPHHFDRLLMMY